MQTMSSRSLPTFLNNVWGVRADDGDVAGAGLELMPVDRDERPTAPHDPGLGVRMAVQVRPLARLVVDEEEGDAGAVLLPLEGQRPARAAFDLAVRDDAIHG